MIIYIDGVLQGTSGGGGGAGSDTTAIHSDTASEISAITEKLLPVSSDFVLIEDSADSNNKKRVQVGNLISSLPFATITDPAVNAAVSTAIVDVNQGVIITLTTSGNAQTIQTPTSATEKTFIVANNDTSTNSITVNGIVLAVGESQKFFWDGSAWLLLSGVDAKDITLIPSGNITATNVQDALYELDGKFPYVVVDATSGAASITSLNTINYINGHATNSSTITIPDAVAGNTNSILRLYKNSGGDELKIVTATGTDLIGGYVDQFVHNNNEGYSLISDGTNWQIIQNSISSHTDVLIADYGALEDWHATRYAIAANSAAVTLTLPVPATLQDKWRQSEDIVFTSIGAYPVYIDLNGNQSTGSPQYYTIWSTGQVEARWGKSVNHLMIKTLAKAAETVVPSDIANLELWLEPFDSTTVTTTGILIDQITDKSGNLNHFTGSLADRPDLLADGIEAGQDSISFTNTEILTAGNKTLHNNTRGFSVVALVKPSTGNDYFFSKFSNNQEEFYIGTGRSRVYETITSGPSTVDYSTDLGSWQFITMTWTPGGAPKIYINKIFQGNANNIITDMGSGTAELLLGDQANIAGYLGEVGFIAAYSRALSYAEVENVIDYAAGITGLTDLVPSAASIPLWERDDTTSTLTPDAGNDNVDLGTGEFTAGKITLNMTQNYEFSERTSALTLQSLTAGLESSLELYTADGDGTDDVHLRIVAVGTPTDITNAEYFDLEYDNVTNSFLIYSQKTGTGTVRPIKIFTDGNTDQIVLNTDGSVNFSGPVNIFGSSIATANSAADDLVIEGTGDKGISILNDATARIFFGDVANNAIGRIQYSHASNVLEFWANNAQRFSVSSAGVFNIAAMTTAGTLVNDSSGNLSSIAFGTANQVLTMNTGATAPEWRDQQFGHNVIINGNFEIWQRGTSFVAMASGAYSVDRMRYGVLGTAVHTLSRSTDVPNDQSNYSLKLDCTTADASIASGDVTNISYRIEGYDFKQFVGKTATLSYWIKAGKTGAMCVSFRNAGNDRSYVVETTIDAADTWEKKTVTLDFDYSGGTWDYINGRGTEITFALSAGSGFQTTADTWQTGSYLATSNQTNFTDSTSTTCDVYFSQIKLELGSVATDFIERPYTEELAMCQRYYVKTFSQSTTPADNAGAAGMILGIGTTTNNSEPSVKWRFPSVMRIAPSITLYNWSTGTSGEWFSGGASSSSARAVFIGEAGCVLDNGGTTLAAANSWYIHAVADAEL